MRPVKGILTEEQEADGFEAFEDEEFVYITRFGEPCLVSGSHTTKESIREVVERIRVRPFGMGNTD